MIRKSEDLLFDVNHISSWKKKGLDELGIILGTLHDVLRIICFIG